MSITMYNGMINSPITTLSSSIGASDTTITVTDATKLPTPPNICTIGTTEDAETVLYTGISESTLTGVTRGFQGAAKAWDSNEIIARYYTTYDHNAFVSNITDLLNGIYSPKITRVNRTSTFDITSTGWVTVQWNNILTDNVSGFNISAPTKITVPTGYTKAMVKCYAIFTNATSGNRYAQIQKNGTTVQMTSKGAVSESGSTIDTGWISCVAGDYFEVQVNTGSTSYDLSGSDSWGGGSWFEITWAKV